MALISGNKIVDLKLGRGPFRRNNVATFSTHILTALIAQTNALVDFLHSQFNRIIAIEFVKVKIELISRTQKSIKSHP